MGVNTAAPARSATADANCCSTRASDSAKTAAPSTSGFPSITAEVRPGTAKVPAIRAERMKRGRIGERVPADRTAQKSVPAARMLKSSHGPSCAPAMMPVASAAGGAHSAAPPALTAMTIPVATLASTAHNKRPSWLPEAGGSMSTTIISCAPKVQNESARQCRSPSRAGHHRWSVAAHAAVTTDCRARRDPAVTRPQVTLPVRCQAQAEAAIVIVNRAP